MTDFPFRIVGFDLDGTLLDTSGDLAAAVNHALATDGHPPLPVAAVRPMIGGGARAMLAQGLAAAGNDDAGAIDRLVPVLLAHYEANIAVQTRPFPGMPEALDALAAMGVRLTVVTNKIERLGRLVLDALDLSDRFDAIIGGDTMGPGRAKPHRAPIDEMIARAGGGRAAFVGDSRFDIEAAHNAGIPAIACRFGFLMEPVEALGADAIIDSYGDLVPALRALAGAAR